MKIYKDLNEKLGFSRRYKDFTVLEVLEKEPDFITFCLKSVRKFNLSKDLRYAHESYMLKMKEKVSPEVPDTEESLKDAVNFLTQRLGIPLSSLEFTSTHFILKIDKKDIKIKRKSRFWITELEDKIKKEYEKETN